MTKEQKQKKLDQLDEMLLNKMIAIMEGTDDTPLSELATVSNYLAKNNKVAEKEKSTIDDDIRNRREEAKKRREKEDK